MHHACWQLFPAHWRVPCSARTHTSSDWLVYASSNDWACHYSYSYSNQHFVQLGAQTREYPHMALLLLVRAGATAVVDTLGSQPAEMSLCFALAGRGAVKSTLRVS
eukprot:scaffold426918_cov25-Prasinocladus_malaysianus.AAC.1